MQNAFHAGILLCFALRNRKVMLHALATSKTPFLEGKQFEAHSSRLACRRSHRVRKCCCRLVQSGHQMTGLHRSHALCRHHKRVAVCRHKPVQPHRQERQVCSMP